MLITAYDSETGLFNATLRAPLHTLSGWFTVTGRKNTEGNTISWSLNWENEDSNSCAATAWVGELYYGTYNIPAIKAVYIHKKETHEVEVGSHRFINDLPVTCEIPY